MMSKKAICLIMTVMLAAIMLALTVFGVNAESDTHAADEIQFNTVSEEDASNLSRSAVFEASITTEPTEPTTEEVIPADFPALTVNAISNFFPTANAEYSVTKKEVTVTYWLKSSKELLSVQWFLAYDSEILSVSEEKNNLGTICPTIGENAVLSFDKDIIKFSSSNVNLYDFSTEEMPFATIIFDVKELDPEESITTKIDLTVDMLCVADKDLETGIYKPETELSLVANSGINPAGMDSVRLSRNTTLTQSNFVQATAAEPETTEPQTDENGNVISASVDEPTEGTTFEAEATASTDTTSAIDVVTENTDVVPTKNNKEDEKTNKTEDNGAINTGTPGFAVICLVVLIVATTILFVMRKKEILYN